MSLEETLRKVERDCESDDLGKARDRLHGLLSSYPDDLALRKKLGHIYGQLRHPALAGRYWYLEENKSDDMTTACRTFERSCGNNSLKMLFALKFRGDIEAIQGTFAGRTLLILQERAQRENGYYWDFGKHGPVIRPPTLRKRFLGIGCVTVLSVAVGLMLLGFITAVRWALRL